ncbi:MAG: hypothetical protein PVG39_12695 [Desulfobacteraceae bacterium]|jgi:hypothetical protein
MSEIVDIEKARLELRTRRGFKNWAGRFECGFGMSTRMEDIPGKALTFLAEGNQKCSFYYYDLIMNLKSMGSGFNFNELEPAHKMVVIDIHLFLLDRARYEYMKRLGWLSYYPGEEFPIVDLVMNFDDLAPDIQARPVILSRSHPFYMEYMSKNLFEREEIIRKLIPEALNRILESR